MKTLDQWLDVYAESHQDPINKLIHNICVPAIFFVIIALIWKASAILLLVAAAVAIGFYYRLGWKIAVLGAVMIAVSILLQQILQFGWLALIFLFALAWVGQFYGHKVEGKKPSFFDDMQFLLIGPLWVMMPMLERFGVKLR